MKKISRISITIILILSIIISYGSVIISMAAESELTLTPKPETNNIHLNGQDHKIVHIRYIKKSLVQVLLKQ